MQTIVKPSLYAALDSSVFVREHWEQTAEEIYETVAFRNVIGNDRRLQTSGVAYARKAHNSEMKEKDAARKRILDSLSREQWPGKLRILTMPGLEWIFERALVSERDYGGSSNVSCCAKQIKTKISSVEYDAAIYFGSLKWMPGARRGITQLSPHCVRTNTIKHYYFSDVESFITDAACPQFHAAWLDFTGYMNHPRLYAIRRFWRARCSWQLAITVLNARYPSTVAAEVKKHGGMDKWVANTLEGELIDSHRYYDDCSAMLQLIIRK